jgi:hypothetical protein
MPLDPGTHRVLVFARGYMSAEQQVVLQDREEKTVGFTLKPIAGVSYSDAPPPGPAPPAPVGTDAAPPSDVPPPPPVVAEGGPPAAPRHARASVLLGAHLGWEVPTGSLATEDPLAPSTDVDSTRDGGSVSYALEGGLRFARQWYVGVVIEHAAFRGDDGLSTTAAAAVLGLIVNPERVSLYGEIGLGGRWLRYQTHDDQLRPVEKSPPMAATLLLGAGLWIPAGKSLRLVPKITLGASSLDQPAPAGQKAQSVTQGFFTLALTGYYNIDL